MIHEAPSSRALFRAQLRRELSVLAQSPADIVNPLMFFFLSITLFALGLRGEPDVLRQFAPVMVWVLVLLANLLSLENLFRRDYEDGTLEQMLLLGRPGVFAIMGKMLAHWLQSGFWLCLLAPLAGLVLFMPASAALFLGVTLLVGTPALSLIGAVGAGLTVGLGRSGLLLALLVLPLYVPVLIFGAGAVVERMAGFTSAAQIYWLGVISVLAVTLAPFATLGALKIGVEQ